MINVHSKRCGHPGKRRRRSSACLVAQEAESCSRHAKKGMLNVRSKRCISHHGCSTIPTFGIVAAPRFLVSPKLYLSATRGVSALPATTIAGAVARAFDGL